MQPPTPARPPSFHLSALTKTIFYLISPFIALFLIVWYFLGILLTLSSRIIAALFAALAWTLYTELPKNHPLLDLPITFSSVAALWILSYPENTRFRSVALLLTYFLLLAYALTRRFLLSHPSSELKGAVNHFIIIAAIIPLWHLIADLKLWVPANEHKLEQIERKIYATHVRTEHHVKMVAGLGTVYVPCTNEEPIASAPYTLVLLHGYLAGNGFWAASLQGLAQSFHVYAVEWKGVGRSLRTRYRPKSHQEADDFFVNSLEEWRVAVQLDKFILCGHSMGAMYATYYAAKYGRHLHQMVLVSPAGMNISPYTSEQHLPWIYRLAERLHLTPMAFVRFAGPFGKMLVRFAMHRRLEYTPPSNVIRNGFLDFRDITEYCFHNWALKSSSDIAMFTHLHPGASAHHGPLCDYFGPDGICLPLTVLYGGGMDWMRPEHGEKLVERLKKTQFAQYYLVPDAGHQVFMDNPIQFNRILIDAVRDGMQSASR